MPVLDTSFFIDLERGLPRAAAALELLAATGEDLIVTSQAATEYLSGVEDRAVALHMLESGFTLSLPSREHILEAARVAREAFDKGVFPGWDDLESATTALLEATYVVTANPKHFVALGVRVWDYRNEPAPRA